MVWSLSWPAQKQIKDGLSKMEHDTNHPSAIQIQIKWEVIRKKGRFSVVRSKTNDPRNMKKLNHEQAAQFMDMIDTKNTTEILKIAGIIPKIVYAKDANEECAEARDMTGGSRMTMELRKIFDEEAAEFGYLGNYWTVQAEPLDDTSTNK